MTLGVSVLIMNLKYYLAHLHHVTPWYWVLLFHSLYVLVANLGIITWLLVMIGLLLSRVATLYSC